MRIPAGLAWWRGEPGGADWLERLPGLVEECAELWSLRVGEPFVGGNVAWVAPAALADGRPVVLKVNFPEAESEHEADALALWAGRSAVRLLAADESRRALLLERALPGTRLWEEPDGDETLGTAAQVLRGLWRPAPQGHRFRLLEDLAESWAEELPAAWERRERPYERSLLTEAVAFLREAGSSQGRQVVCHQDYHGGNVLRSAREPWLVIDPKPVVGEREFDTASLLRDRRWELRVEPHPGRRIRRRLDRLASVLDLDRERMRGWGIAHALAWDPDEDVIACARWLAAA
ncbi:MAG TPA: aminoglycoside phosphotransferase family protein [Gaiellaceae bacterium]|nr:aminoglycoside phosphotransferase family protein [Gaiellaceae bacterium]